MMARRTKLFLALIVAANAASVLLFSGAGPIPPSTSSSKELAWHPALAFVANSLTIPLPTPEISNIRDVVLPFACGLVLIGAAMARFSKQGEKRDVGPNIRTSSPATGWLWRTAAPALLIAILSAFANESVSLSYGWIVRFMAGAAWAIIIGRTLSQTDVRRGVLGLLAVGLTCLVLAIAHRADRGLVHFVWPIGPITTTAAFAAIWASIAIVYVGASALRRRFGAAALLALIVSAIAIYALLQTGRRAPMFGLVGATAITTAGYAWHRLRGRNARWAIPAFGVLLIAAAAIVVVQQRMSDDRTASGSLALRFEYWRLSVGLIADHPSLGVGPDMFVVDMTNAVTPLRSVAPHVYHGNIDPYAHNEWIQAVVELGIPGGLFYLAIPIGVLFIAVSRVRRPTKQPEADGDGRISADALDERAVLIASIAAGLIALLILDSASITLRTSLMPIWYWTLIGLLSALCRKAEPSNETTSPQRRPKATTFRNSCLLLTGFAFVGVSCLDLSHAADELDLNTAGIDRPFSRLYAAKTIDDRSRAAVITSQRAAQTQDPSAAEDAVRRWAKLFSLVPGLHDNAARYADALLRTGNNDHARWVIEAILKPDGKPYDRSANLLCAWLPGTPPERQLRCVQRALRNAALDRGMVALLDDIADDETVVPILKSELPAARERVRNQTLEGADDCGAELLRINARLLERAGRYAEALADQRLAAAFYIKLERTNARYRRGHDAETDATYQLARLIYAHDRTNYKQAFDAILAAERFSLLGMPHEQAPSPRPQDGFFLGEVIPTIVESPEQWRDLWKLSALLHIVVNNEQYLPARISFYLPAKSRSMESIRRELANLTRQAYTDLGTIPQDKRPAHYAQLPSLADGYESGVADSIGEAAASEAQP